jgi:folate-dependent phosphoribosylglycinamide formyltransferase PurN
MSDSLIIAKPWIFPAPELVQLYNPSEHRKARIALCMSGTGTNVERILEMWIREGIDCPFEPVAIISDDERSRGREIRQNFKVPYYLGLDIRDFQEARGLERKLTLATPDYREAREEYTEKLHKILKPFDFDFLVFGGFEPLTNITKYFLCLNVHPGDLTYLKDGKRYLVGLQTFPIERAIEENIGFVRSSVIQAMPYNFDGKSEMDNGPILGLGPKLFYEDERDPKVILKMLKEKSDWNILPPTVCAVARGEIYVDYKTLDVRNRVVLNDEYRISEMK